MARKTGLVQQLHYVGAMPSRTLVAKYPYGQRRLELTGRVAEVIDLTEELDMLERAAVRNRE